MLQASGKACFTTAMLSATRRLHQCHPDTRNCSREHAPRGGPWGPNITEQVWHEADTYTLRTAKHAWRLSRRKPGIWTSSSCCSDSYKRVFSRSRRCRKQKKQQKQKQVSRPEDASGHGRPMVEGLLWMAVMDQTLLDMRDSGNLDGFGVLEGLLDITFFPFLPTLRMGEVEPWQRTQARRKCTSSATRPIRWSHLPSAWQ